MKGMFGAHKLKVYDDKVLDRQIEDYAYMMRRTAGWDDLPPIPIFAAKPGGAAPTWATFTGNLELPTFAVNDYVYGCQEVMHTYEEGTDIDIHVHWANQSSDGTNRGVKWQVTYSVANIDSQFPTETVVSAETSIPANTVARSHFYSDIGTIAGTTLKIGSYIVWQLKRIASSATAPSAAPYGLTIGFHVKHDGWRSREESSK